MRKLYLDFETFSEVPLKYGVNAYAEQADIMLAAYALDDGPVTVWDLTDIGIGAARDMHADLFDALVDDDFLIHCHNTGFDRVIARKAKNSPAEMVKAAMKPERWHCTMTRALAHGLPGKLEVLSDIFKLSDETAKDKEGKSLIQLFCKPRPKKQKLRRANSDTHPEEWRRFVRYAALDIESMRVLNAKIPSWNYRGAELALWHLDQRINDRGVAVDLDLACSAIRAVDRAQQLLSERTQEITDNKVEKTTQRDRLLKYILEDHDVSLPDMRASTLERRIDDPNLPQPVRELLAIRLQASTTSVSKYNRLLNAVSKDGRLRGTLQFCGASRTGRWAGRVFQPQNLPRPSLKNDDIEFGIIAMKNDCEDLFYNNVMQLTSSAIRGALVAPKNRKLVVSDLSNIEGRAQAWLAGEEWKLEAFRAFDRGEGFDLYNLAYAKSFGILPKDVTKAQRQVGKVQELAFGYQGGVGAWLTFSLIYGIDLEEMAAAAYPTLPKDALRAAETALARAKQRKKTFGLSDRAYIVCDAFKVLWRKAHEQTNSYWDDLEDTVRKAISLKGKTFVCRKLSVRCDGAWLRIILPSGRALCYPSPRVEDRGQINYMGMNQYSRKWSRIKTYGGKLSENVCQAVARDVMGANMPLIENEGYAIVLSVHDELITETPDDARYNSKHLSELLSTPPLWAPDMPLAAGGFETRRYRKDD